MEEKKINNKNYDVITYKNGKQFAFCTRIAKAIMVIMKLRKINLMEIFIEYGMVILTITGQAKNNKLDGTLTEYEPGTGQIKREINYKNESWTWARKNFENGKAKINYWLS
nr:hypothetical protein [Mycoplasmopsis bovis]